MNKSDRFVRVPTDLLEALLKTPLTGTQFAILFWIMRQTYGWNQSKTRFSWYQIARELGLSRPAAYRLGMRLVSDGILSSMTTKSAFKRILCSGSSMLWLPGGNGMRCLQTTTALLTGNYSVARRQRFPDELKTILKTK